VTDKSNYRSRFAKLVSQNGVILIFLVIFSIFAILTAGISIRPSNIRSMLVSGASTGLMAIGMTLVIIDRGIDLSVGGVAALSSAIGAILMTRTGLPWIICILVMLSIGTLVGFFNGVAIAVLKMPPFICTMATLKITTGLALFILGGTTIYGLPKIHSFFGQGYLIDIPVCVLMLAIFMAIAFVMLRYSSFGRELYAMGGNPKAAWTAGINVVRNRIVIYMMSGFMAAVAALVITSKVMCAQVSIGEGSELDAIASAVIGGVSMAGGEGNVIFAVIGTLVITMIDNGLNLLKVSPYIQTAIKGSVIFSAVASDLIRRRKNLDKS
jgi:ribose/xylose/arabinose/galactoside ABC-type transport system permease subunit